jgi:hypothetical protein
VISFQTKLRESPENRLPGNSASEAMHSVQRGSAQKFAGNFAQPEKHPV